MSEGTTRVLVAIALRDLDHCHRISGIMSGCYSTPEPDFLVMVANTHPTLNERGLYDPWPNILRKYEFARQTAIVGGYDFLFLVEDDIVLPVNALDKLIALNLPVVSGIYRLRPEASEGRAPLAVFRFTTEEREKGRRWPTSISNRGEDAPEGLLEVDAVAFGCLLVREDVFTSKGELDIEERLSTGTPFDVDMEYAAALRKRPVTMFVDGEVRCGHISRDGSIVYP